MTVWSGVWETCFPSVNRRNKQGSTPFLVTLNPDDDNRRAFWLKSELRGFLLLADPRTTCEAGFDVIMDAVAKFGHWGLYIQPTPEKALELGLPVAG
jgi:hypothetical protein